MNIYKLTYFEYDKAENMYYEAFCYTVRSNKTEEEMNDIRDKWNEELAARNISGMILCTTVLIQPLDNLSIDDFIINIQDL